MILILGGTSETRPIAVTCRLLGHPVMVSTATDAALDVGEDCGVERRCGRLDHEGLGDLIRQRGITHLIDATHPYAVEVSRMAKAVTDQVGITYQRYQRPASSELPGSIIRVQNHQEAAEKACTPGARVFLTTGSRNLLPYVAAAADVNCDICARVLNNDESLKACRQAGLKSHQLITARGPFDRSTNLRQLRDFDATVLVTKDGGDAAAMVEKCSAAEEAGCTIILISRPE